MECRDSKIKISLVGIVLCSKKSPPEADQFDNKYRGISEVPGMGFLWDGELY